MCKGLLSTRSGEGKGEGTLHLWYHVPYLFTVAGSSIDKHNSRVAVWIAAWCLFTWFFLCKRTGLVSVYRWLTIGCTESHLISEGSVWFWSTTVTSREAHPQALCVPRCPCPPRSNHNGWWGGHNINIIPPTRAPAQTSTTTATAPTPTQAEWCPRPGPGPRQHSCPTLMRGDRTGRFTRPLQWRWGCSQCGTETAGGHWEKRRRWEGGGGTNSHKREQVELKLTGSAEQLNVSNCSQRNVWEWTDKTY